jgi:hypothetical protein
MLTASAPFPWLATPEANVLPLLIALVVVAAALTALLWFGTVFVQAYLYTSPAESLYWRAPTAAVTLTSFYFLWALMNVWGGSRSPVGVVEIPLGVLWEFSPRVEIVAEPVPKIVSKRRSSEPSVYVLDKASPREVRYRKANGEEYWSAAGAEYVEFKHNGQEYKFIPDKKRDESYVVFVDADTGLEMREFEIGRVGYTSYGLLAEYMALNLLHLLLWVACLGLLLEFQLVHAVGLGFVMWVLTTVAVFPGLFERAAAAVA